MLETETAADGPEASDSAIRVIAEAIVAIQTPFRDAAGQRDPEQTDYPALAMATVAAPVAIALVGRGLEGLVSGGLLAAIAFGLAGAIVTGVLATLAVAVLWGIEAILIRPGRLPLDLLPRTYRYALAFLATTGLPNNLFAGLCLAALGLATLVGCVRRAGSAATPAGMSRGMLSPAMGYFAFHVAMTIFFALHLQTGILAIVSGAFSAVFGVV